jgi:tetratricopeptide (TPR) repeat protein
MSQIALYIGWYDANVSGPFTRPTVEFMPGAFAYHLHSFSAASLRNTKNNWVAPLLAKGVTITMGTVDEPYLGGTPDIGVFTARLLFHAMTFGEAAYASQNVLSWQTTVVGDPLYRPFGKPLKQLHAELAARHSKLIEWSYLRVANMNLARGGKVMEAVGYLEGVETTRHSAVLSEKLGDLYTAQGKPSSAVLINEQALQLDPSPQQRIRLRLTLGDELMALDRPAEALADFQKFLAETPDYPDKLPIYRKLLPLAQKLGQKDDAAKYEEQIKRLSEPAKP